MAMMDRAKKDELPKMQVGFIDSVCLPLYKVSFSQVNHSLFRKHLPSADSSACPRGVLQVRLYLNSSSQWNHFVTSWSDILFKSCWHCLPSLQAFAQMNPKLQPLKEGCRENKLQWQKLADDYKAQVFLSFVVRPCFHGPQRWCYCPLPILVTLFVQSLKYLEKYLVMSLSRSKQILSIIGNVI